MTRPIRARHDGWSWSPNSSIESRAHKASVETPYAGEGGVVPLESHCALLKTYTRAARPALEGI
jgi:hypothetical protein